MARETAAPPPPGPANELLSLRLHPRDLQVLSEAAAQLQVSLSEFVVLAAYQRAKQVLAEALAVRPRLGMGQADAPHEGKP